MNISFPTLIQEICDLDPPLNKPKWIFYQRLV